MVHKFSIQTSNFREFRVANLAAGVKGACSSQQEPQGCSRSDWETGTVAASPGCRAASAGGEVRPLRGR